MHKMTYHKYDHHTCNLSPTSPCMDTESRERLNPEDLTQGTDISTYL
jgi:hypothetical protein